MQQTTQKALIIGGTCIAGGAAGNWAAGRLATSFGMQLGPWGPVIGVVIGALAGSLLSSRLAGESEDQLPFEESDPSI